MRRIGPVPQTRAPKKEYESTVTPKLLAASPELIISQSFSNTYYLATVAITVQMAPPSKAQPRDLAADYQT
jgi:hypothetical protein